MAHSNKTGTLNLSKLIEGLILLMEDDACEQVVGKGKTICDICQREGMVCDICPLSNLALPFKRELKDLAKRLAVEELLEQ